MKRLSLITLSFLMASSAFAANPVTDAVHSIENGYQAKCAQILLYPPSIMSDDTTFNFKCVRAGSPHSKNEILLEVVLDKSNSLRSVNYRECSQVHFKNTLWHKEAFCD